MLSRSISMQKTTRFTLAIVICLFILSGTVMAVLAAKFTINTNNGAVDATWPAAIYTSNSTCAKPLNSRDEIQYGWAGNDDNYYYFRIQTCASPALSADSRRFVGGIDCNNDGDVDDPDINPGAGQYGDRLVVWQPSGSNDAVWLTDGARTLVAGQSPTDGERINANIELRVPFADLPPVCRGQSNVVGLVVATVDTSVSPAVVIDSSPIYPWNVPTVIELNEFQAQQNMKLTWFGAAGLVALVLVGTGGWAFLRRRKG